MTNRRALHPARLGLNPASGFAALVDVVQSLHVRGAELA
jgi:hypothetical protein